MHNFQCKTCSNCNAVNALDSYFCAKCGQPLDASSYSKRPGVWQHSKNTITITALAGSTLFFIIVSSVMLNSGTPTTPVSFKSSTQAEPAASANIHSPTPDLRTPARDTKSTLSNKLGNPAGTQSNVAEQMEQLRKIEEESRKDAIPSSRPPREENLPSRTSPQTSGRVYLTGPRRGCYYINGNGNKTYVDRSLCGGTSSTSSPSGFYSAPSTSPRSSSPYIRGPRGGCYMITASGSKRYVDRSMCN